MARLTEALMKKESGDQKGLQKFSNAPLLNLTYGGMHGWTPNYAEYVNNQAYVRRNSVCILLEAPRFFSYMENAEEYVQILKMLLEEHAISFEGFNAELTVEVDEHAVGGGGQKQHEYVNVTMAQSEPVYNFVEKYGRPIQMYIETWIRYGIMDPDTKFALINTIANKGTNGTDYVTDMLSDMYSCTVLVMEMDPTHTTVVKSFICTNMFPKTTGEIVAKRDLTQNNEILNLSIPFTGLTQSNAGTNEFAQKILNNIQQKGASPYMRKAFTELQRNKDLYNQEGFSAVEGAKKGYESDLEAVTTERVEGFTGFKPNPSGNFLDGIGNTGSITTNNI